MNYKGVIIEESLGEKSVLTDVTIVGTKVEEVTESHKTPWIKQWTLHTVEIPEDKIDSVAKKISKSFDPLHPDWYADFKNENFHYIIFANKPFKVDLKNPVLYKDAKDYGMTIGIPEYQLDFAPDDKIGDR
jgi:hypothetical protein